MEMNKIDRYHEFIKNKVALAPVKGFEVDRNDLPQCLKPHQADIVQWALRGGCRAIFAAFGLGKTLIQLAVMQQVVKRHPECRTLIVMPLGVKQEFIRDGRDLLDMKMEYVRTNEEVSKAGQYCITNYERVRDGQIDPEQFLAVSLDEAAILRGFGTKTFQEFLKLCKKVRYKFVATATPSPNEYKELIHYAGYLGIMDTGEALTRFFQRNPEKAGDLTLYPHKEREFWMWVASWAVFVRKPSDLGYSDDGYDLPPLKIHWHRVEIDHLAKVKVDRDGQQEFFHNASLSMPDASREKRDTIPLRIGKMLEIVKAEPEKHFLLWHHLEKERRAIEAVLPEAVSVYGEQPLEEREQNVIDFSDGRIQYLATKPVLSGSGCNFQRHCSDAIFVGIDCKFNDFIQAIHRIYRFLQTQEVNIHIIYADSEEGIREILLEKWKLHDELGEVMSGIIRKYGLSADSIRAGMRRTMGCNRQEMRGKHFIAVNNDNVEEIVSIPDRSVHLILTSIPFSNHYEYSPSYNDFGHTLNNRHFFRQMDYLTPELLRILIPGRVAAIHVKDRILFGSVTGSGMPTLDPFSDMTVFHFMKHGFQYMGRITIETDVVAENNQTYRLGWSENCKDGSKMGVGCPEYLLLFRKLPSDTSKAYSDVRVKKSKADYSRGRWQIDARAKWNSSGNRILMQSELENYELEQVNAIFYERMKNQVYDYEEHVKIAESMDRRGRLPAKFEAFRVPARTEHIWDDVIRMRTLNGEQVKKNLEKHICPLQFDIVDRVINRYTNEGETVFDPFGGIMTVPYRAVKLKRFGYGIELNHGYYMDGIDYLIRLEAELEAMTLFDFAEIKNVATN